MSPKIEPLGTSSAAFFLLSLRRPNSKCISDPVDSKNTQFQFKRLVLYLAILTTCQCLLIRFRSYENMNVLERPLL